MPVEAELQPQGLPPRSLPSPTSTPNLMAMIQDVDESLRALVKRDALNGSRADIAFDAPTKDWAARRNTPTVDLYLYDIREDLERREVVWENVKDDTGRVTERRPPPRRFRLSYLVTAWTQRPEDEHRLLSAVLSCFLRNETIPRELAAGALASQKLPTYLTIALPPGSDRSISDVWSALGGELKPSLDLVVTAPVDVARAIPAGPPVLEEPKFIVARPDTGPEEVPAGGKPRGKRGVAAGAALEPQARPAPGAPAPSEARPVGAAGPSGPKETGRLKPGDAVTTATPAEQEESVRSGKERQPGRILRVRGIPRS